MDSLQAPEENVNRHSVKCELHDLHFNPSEQSGCVLCLREERKAENSRRVLLIVVGLLGLAFLVASVHQATRSDGGNDLLASASASSRPEDEGAASLSVGLNAEPYRDEIARIEGVLYKKAPAAEADLDSAAAAARDLAERIRAKEPSIRSGPVVARLLGWASNSLESDVGYATPGLGRARSGWEEFRDDVFVAAPWFEVADSSTEAAQNPPPPGVDPAVVASLRIVSNDVFHLIRVGRLESDAIGEVVSDVGSDAAVHRTRERWREWTRDWARQVQRVAKKLPAPPSMASDINLLLAYQKSVAALNDLSLVPVSGGDEPVPYLYQRRSRFEAAEREAAEAEARLKILE